MPEISEADLAAREAEREELKREREARAKSDKERDEVAAAYQRDMQAMTQYVTTLSQPQQHQQAPATDDDSLFVADDPKKRQEQFNQQIHQTVRQTVAPLAATYIVDKMANCLDRVSRDPTLPDFATYRTDIEKILNDAVQYDHRVASDESVRRAYDLVDAQKQRERRLKKQSLGEAGEEYEEEETAQSVAAPEPQRKVAALVGGGSGARVTAAPAKRRVRLSDDERIASEMLNVSHEDYAQYKDPNYVPDVLGFRGRKRV